MESVIKVLIYTVAIGGPEEGIITNLPVRDWKAYTKGLSLYEVLTYSQRNLEAKIPKSAGG